MQRIRALGAVDLPRCPARHVQVVLGDLALAVCVDDEQPIAGEIGALAQIGGRVVGRLGVLAHDKQHRPLAGGGEDLVEPAPAPDGDVEPLAV